MLVVAVVISFPLERLVQLLLSVTVKVTVKGPEVDWGLNKYKGVDVPIATVEASIVGAILFILKELFEPCCVDVAAKKFWSVIYTYALYSPSRYGTANGVVVAGLPAAVEGEEVAQAPVPVQPVEVEKLACLQT